MLYEVITQSVAYQPAEAEASTDQPATNAQPPAAGPAEPEAAASAGAADLPKLRPSLEPETQVATAASQTFAYPVYDIYRLNYCLNWGRDCGAPAADVV